MLGCQKDGNPTYAANLTWLNLDDNQLTELPESIGKLTKLKNLDLANNPSNPYRQN
ncbi:MAG: leucine-rich repeat domain-containing protein [Methylococcales bacterium]